MIKKNSLSYFLLLGLEKSIQSGVLLIDFAYNSHWYVYPGRDPRDINYGALYQAVRDLREKGFIETEKDGRKIMLKLTDKGREEAIVKKLLAEEKWDRKWRIVIFDVPEKHRKLRKILRSKLREWEFEPWQKSVWAGKKDVTSPLRNFIKEVGLSDWVRVVVGADVA
ncbi:helix-turn-helix transcriptional regulator [Candidatus Daviesbacteria bacterium]|nr:helix-turn-helix transcriptional regulator [Candidatus Daviesbacteria bacterium]